MRVENGPEPGPSSSSASSAGRLGELVEVAEIRQEWSRLVVTFREPFLSAGAFAVQRGWVRPSDEAAFQGWIDSILEQLSKGGRPALEPRVPFPRRRPANEPA
jgi:hypothetical protein